MFQTTGYKDAVQAKVVAVLVLGLAVLASSAVAQSEYYNVSTNDDNTITITGYTGPLGVLSIPSSINGLPVTQIGDNAIRNNPNITSVTIPDSVLKIGAYAFYWCELTNVIIGNHVVNIGEGAFGIGRMSSITIPNSVTNLGAKAFEGCSLLTSVTIPNSVTSIEGTFRACGSLTNVTIPNSVTYIGNEAFSYCWILKSVTIPNSVTNLGASAFVGCDLRSVTIPDSVISIGDYAFSSCGGLSSVIIGNSVTNIGNNAFANCGILTTLLFRGNAPSSDGMSIFSGSPLVIAYRYSDTTGWGDYFGNAPVVVLDPSSLPPAPVISSQPQDVVVDANSFAVLNVTATGPLPFSYRWMLNGTNLVNETTSTLTITNVKPANIGAYVVVVTNDFGAATSSIANIYMRPHLSSPFQGAVTYWGKDTTLSAGAWGSEVLNFQWYKNGVVVADATNATLLLNAIQFNDAGLYSVVVSNAWGSVTNAAYQVVVNAANISIKLCPDVVIEGTVGYSYQIQSTSDLSDTNAWLTLTNLTLTQPIQYWDDIATDAYAHPKKFYRVLPGQ